MKNIVLTTILASSLFLATLSPALAVSTPTFPSCANPQGQIKVTYSDGTHGIAGSTSTYTGRDAVYTLSDDTVTQCFCSTDGQGIQTNWWKASSLSDEEINILKADGWIYIPAGNLWGLAEAPYVAKNINYSCLSGGSSNGGSTSSSSNNSSGSVLGDGIGGGDPEGDVLGLAATGDAILVYGSFAIGIVLLWLGIKRLTRHT